MVVKSQILAGGRGLGKFTSGLQGGVHIVKIDQAEEIAGMSSLIFYYFLIQKKKEKEKKKCNFCFIVPIGKMLGQTLVTKQTGPQGKVVSKVCLHLY